MFNSPKEKEDESISLFTLLQKKQGFCAALVVAAYTFQTPVDDNKWHQQGYTVKNLL